MEGKGRFFNVSCMIVILVWSAFSLAACGSSGGGGTPAGISYTGLTTLVAIDANNAVDIGTGAYQGGSTAGAIGSSMGIVQNSEDEYIGRSRSLILSQALVKALRQIDVNSMSSGIASGTIQHNSGTEYGTCGGSMSWSINFNDQTGGFTGSFNFNNYCEDNTTLSGSIEAAGTIDPVTEDFGQISMTFIVFTIATPSDSFTAQGSFDINFSVSSIDFAINIYMREDSTGKVYWLDDFNMSVAEETGYADVEISGNFYDPDYGYVILSTSTPLRIYDSDDYPSQGILIVTGETGIGGGSTKARLTAHSSTTYEVEADTNGDGTYDWTSGILNWSDL